MRSTFNIKQKPCCALTNPLQRELIYLTGVYSVNIDIFNNTVNIDHTDEVSEKEIFDKLISLGYIDSVDLFSHKAASWDSPAKIAMSVKFFREVVSYIKFNEADEVIDLGCGTGLLGLQIAPLVKKVFFIDKSIAMLTILKDKISGSKEQNTEVINGTIGSFGNRKVDKILSLMAFHHIDDIDETIETISRTIIPGGEFIIGDLCEEDGSFHYPEVVFHNGFNVDNLCAKIESYEFEIKLKQTFSSIKKNNIDYKQFIIIAKKK